MNRSLACLVTLSILLCVTHATSAQMKSDPSGTWGGAMTTDVATTGIEVILARDATGWKATIKARPPSGQEIVWPVQDLQITDANISFAAERPRNLVKFAGKFAGDKVSGEVEIFENGRKIRSGTFALSFGGKMPAAAAPQAGGQMADPDFNGKVDTPAYKKSGPKVLFDEAHNNFHTATGRYKPFADLITNDGYQIVPNKQSFSAGVLKGYRVLVISNALGALPMNDPNAGNPAFTDAESDAVREWVGGGGSLLLIADHAPMGAANQVLGKRFDVDMSKMFTIDAENSDKEAQNPSFIIYTRESGRLADHPVTRGRNASECVNKVIAFTGQSLKGPADSVAFMKLADTAMDAMPGQNTNPVSAAGRAQGIAIKFGKGRVIVLAEAGMLSAQVVGAGAQQLKFGMNRPGIDNRQLALNIMHWLSGILE
jgi:hypothetical protein